MERKRDSRTAFDVAEHELLTWARRLDVEAHLDDSVTEIGPFLEGGGSLLGDGRSAPLGDVRRAALGRVTTRGIAAHEIKAAARRYLEACAAEASQQARREMLWRRPPAAPQLANIAAPLRTLEAELRESTPAAARVRADAIGLDPSVPCLLMRGSDTEPEVQLVLTGHAHGELVLEPADAPPRRALSLVRTALDAVHDPSHALHAKLVDALGTPGWRRMIESLDASLEPDEDEDDDGEVRLAFRVGFEADGAPTLDVAQQRRGARGKWTKGTRVLPGVALNQFALMPSESLALRALGDGTKQSQIAEALFALADGGAIIAAEGSTHYEVRRVEARFALADEAGGLRPALALGDARIPVEIAASRVRGATCVAHVLKDRGLVLVGAVGKELVRLVMVAAEYSAVVPTAQRSEILPLVERVAARVPIALSAQLENEVQVLDPHLFVRITPDDSGATVELRTRLSPSTSAEAGEGATLVSILADGTATPVLRRRDLAKEREVAEALARELTLTRGETRAHITSEDALLSLLAALHERPEIEVEWPDSHDRARYVGAIGRAGLRVNVRTAAEWFGVEGEVEIDGEIVKLADLLAQVRAGRRFIRLSSGRFAMIADDLRERLVRAADVIFTQNGELRVVAAAGDALEALVDEGQLRADEAWHEIRQALAKGALVEPDVPEGLTATLRDYQRQGFVWLARLAQVRSGAVLADDMGLGKTIQALTLLIHRASEGPALVVAPTSLGDNWAREGARFAPGLRMRVHRGPGRQAALEADPLRPGDVLIASYDVVALDQEKLQPIAFGTLVLDEAQAVKNPEAQRTKAVRDLNAKVRIALTGTPLENRLSELWSIVSTVHPGLLGPWEHFRARFAQPIEKEQDGERLSALSTLVRPYLLRRTKEVVTPELPPRIEIVREVSLSDAERKLYDAERSRAIAALTDAGESDRFRVLASITRLRQLACDSALVVPDAAVSSSKIAALLELVEELESAGRKVLVFSQFVRLLERVAEVLKARNISHFQLDGSTSPTERSRLVERFQRGEATVFLLSLKAGGVGLTLTAADTVVHLDPWWNPAVEDQASDRAHRIGQDKSVTIVRLVSQDTIEEAVLSLHAAKRALTRGVLEGADAASVLSATELVDLIRHGAVDAATKR